MKTFITSLLLFCTISLFAQPQKGDLYLGFSNFRFSSFQNTSDFTSFSFAQRTLFIAPNFGKFITDNTLISGGFSMSANLSNRGFLGPNPNPTTFWGANFLCAQYFGKGKLRGLGQIILNANLTESDFINLRRSIDGSFEFGGAYFVNEFTSLQLQYRVNLFSVSEGSDTEYFTTGIEPNLGLSLRTFLLRNREGIENLSALNSIKKGTSTLSLSSRFRNNSDFNLLSFAGGFRYFIADNRYLSADISVDRSRDDISPFESSSSYFALSGACYLRIKERFYAKLSTGISREGRYSNTFIGSDNEFVNETNAFRWNTTIGTAFFLGRHKLEPGIGFRVSSTQVKNLGIDRIGDVSPNLFINYEWFLAQNFTFAANADFRTNDVFYTVSSLSFSPFEPVELRLIDFPRNTSSLNVGFKWYLSTPTE